MPVWFEQLFGFQELPWAQTQACFVDEGERLVSTVNGRTFRVGRFDTPDLARLRASPGPTGRLTVSHEVIGDVLALHARPENQGATFQVASQLNCLEFVGPDVVPEDGITGYAHDRTQGPACALAAAAATAWRNYCMPFPHGRGQTRDRQLNTLDGLARLLGEPLFDVRNGYTSATAAQLDRLAARLDQLGRDRALDSVRIGFQSQVGVDFASRWQETASPTTVSQAFCSAVSCAYAPSTPLDAWAPLACLVLDAAYEATLRAAARDQAQGRGSGKVWLTFLGGGVFGNRPTWIGHAIGRALDVCADLPLDVRIAHYGQLDPVMTRAIGGRPLPAP